MCALNSAVGSIRKAAPITHKNQYTPTLWKGREAEEILTNNRQRSERRRRDPDIAKSQTIRLLDACARSLQDRRRHPRDQPDRRRIPTSQSTKQLAEMTRVKAQRDRRSSDFRRQLRGQLVAEDCGVDAQRNRAAEAARCDHQARCDGDQFRGRGQLRHDDQCVQSRPQAQAQERRVAQDVLPPLGGRQTRHERVEQRERDERQSSR